MGDARDSFKISAYPLFWYARFGLHAAKAVLPTAQLTGPLAATERCMRMLAKIASMSKHFPNTPDGRQLRFSLTFTLLWMCLCIPRGYSFQAHQSGIDEFNAALQNGVNLARNGDLKAAEEAFRHAVALRPQDPRALTALGQVQEQLGEISGAIRTFRTVLALDPNSSDAHVNLGIAFGDQGDQAALNESAKAIELAPKSANAHFLRGRPLDDLGSKEKARGEFRAVLEISPKFVEALHFLALLESDDGNVSEAADLLRQHLRLRPRRH